MSASVILYLCGMGVLFVGERLLGADHALRGLFAALSLLALGGAVGLRLRSRTSAEGERRGAESTALVLTAAGAASLLLYALTLPQAASVLGIEAGGRFSGALSALWPIAWLAATIPLLLVDWTLGQMPVRTQPRRVRHALQMGLCLAFAISLAFPVNYIATRHSLSLDWRQIRTTAAGEATQAVVEALTDPVEVYLFFPPANDVARELRPYFEDLRGLSDLLRVETVDQAVHLELAERLRVSSNGSVVLARGDEIERVNVGTSLDGARSQLRRFDELFQSRLLSLTRRERTIYFTVGHEEMHWSPVGDEPQTRVITGAKRILEQLNYTVADLGVGQGLGRAVPDDAALVVIAGPRQPFLPEEIASLERYAREGGRLLLLLEPGKERHQELASLFGVRYHPELIHSDRHHFIRSRTKADRAFIGTDRFSSHPSVGTLARYSRQLALIMDGAGWLEISPEPGLRVSATVRSMPQSWADVVANHDFDADSERRATWDLGAASSRDGEDGSYRGAVLAASSAISDALIGNQANLQWLIDTVRWLTDDEDLSGLVASEEDVRIQHTREQDVAWFYGTIFGVPLLVLIGGLVHVKRRRRRSAS